MRPVFSSASCLRIPPHSPAQRGAWGASPPGPPGAPHSVSPSLARRLAKAARAIGSVSPAYGRDACGLVFTFLAAAAAGSIFSRSTTTRRSVADPKSPALTVLPDRHRRADAAADVLGRPFVSCPPRSRKSTRRLRLSRMRRPHDAAMPRLAGVIMIVPMTPRSVSLASITRPSPVGHRMAQEHEVVRRSAFDRAPCRQLHARPSACLRRRARARGPRPARIAGSFGGLRPSGRTLRSRE